MNANSDPRRRPTTPLPGPLLTPAESTAQRLERLDGIAERIRAHVAFMRGIGGLAGASKESKDRAVASCYACLVACDGQLGQVSRSLPTT